MSTLCVMLDGGAVCPTRAHKTDAGLDLCTSEAVSIQGGEKKLVSTGVHFAIPDGYFGLVALRSGFASKNPVVLANGVGIIDAGYRGPVKLCLLNTSAGRVDIDKGDRIAQMVIIPCLLSDIELCKEIAASDRGSGGFGSTGV